MSIGGLRTPPIMFETLCKNSQQLEVVNNFGKIFRLKQLAELRIHLWYQNQILKSQS